MKSFAKINIFLSILGKLPEPNPGGYHEIVSIMQRLHLHDSLDFAITGQSDKINPQVELVLTHENNTAPLATDNTNIVVRAAKLFLHTFDVGCDIRINLTKRIPIGAGLGGGSSNAAATLLGLCKLFNLNPPNLMAMGKSLGADVPFFIAAHESGGTQLAQGIGEVLSPLNPHPKCFVALAFPGVHVSTRTIFEMLHSGSNGNFATASMQCNMQAHEFWHSNAPLSNLNNIKDGIAKQDLECIAQNLHNTFTPITSQLHPEIMSIISGFCSHGALGAQMTGTGATVFAYFDCKKKAHDACAALENMYPDVQFCVTHIF